MYVLFSYDLRKTKTKNKKISRNKIIKSCSNRIKLIKKSNSRSTSRETTVVFFILNDAFIYAYSARVYDEYMRAFKLPT